MSTVQSVPMWRLTERMVRSTLVTACRLATSPTSTSPFLANATTDGVVRAPSALAMTVGSPPSRTETTELVVPRSMPTARAMGSTSGTGEERQIGATILRPSLGRRKWLESDRLNFTATRTSLGSLRFPSGRIRTRSPSPKLPASSIRLGSAQVLRPIPPCQPGRSQWISHTRAGSGSPSACCSAWWASPSPGGGCCGSTGWRAPASRSRTCSRTRRKAVEAEAVEVLGQRKLLKWTVPGVAHVFAFWGFLVLGLTIIEAYGALFSRDVRDPGDRALGAASRSSRTSSRSPSSSRSSSSRSSGSATTRPGRAASPGSTARTLGAAWLVLFMIFNVVWTLLLYRGRADQHRRLPLPDAARSPRSGWPTCSPARRDRQRAGSRSSASCCRSPSCSAFLVLVVYSKHLHIFLAPFNVFFSRRPNALGPLAADVLRRPGRSTSRTRARTTSSASARSRTSPGRASSTSPPAPSAAAASRQCPAWNTGKPLSPKLLIMDLRDHAFAKAPYLLAQAHPTYLASGRARPAAGTGRASTSFSRGGAGRGRPGPGRADRARRARALRSAAASSTPTCCGRAPPAAPASSSARSTSSTSTTSSTCAATR